MDADTGHSATTRVSPEQVDVLARAAQLDLPAERLDALVQSFSDFLTGFAPIRALATGDREPPTLSHSEEANA